MIGIPGQKGPAQAIFPLLRRNVTGKALYLPRQTGRGAAPAGQTARRMGFHKAAVPRTKLRIMTGLFYILFFWLVGNVLSRLTGNIVSGNIIGMVLLFASLCLHWVKAETVRPAARFLLAGMALFFVPFGVGLMDSYRVILDNLWAVVVSGVVSTVAVLLVAGKTFQRCPKRRPERRSPQPPGPVLNPKPSGEAKRPTDSTMRQPDSFPHPNNTQTATYTFPSCGITSSLRTFSC